ncbi:MAG TPA: arsenosugar biosynthesis radical SAM (seleno)protein ArsS [Tepidisphaeraceae bacterium]|nr:arsenosugar biosynthesis radical SAM (seleno)protein ArsS [Tepidisphaeraceae bacterium]
MSLSLPLLQMDNAFDQAVRAQWGAPLDAAGIGTVQVNIGLRCNLACRHCHVESSPKRTEEMSWPTMLAVLAAARSAGATTLDITGGAPEMHPHFRQFVSAARRQDLAVIVRTNLTILLEPAYAELVAFMRDQAVHLIASLPCYLESNVDRQRGHGTYNGSVEAIRRLNAAGFGVEPQLPLDLVYNPLGAKLPPAQQSLEADYRRELRARFDIEFTRLLTITNLPIGRFLHDLAREGKDAPYVELLRNSFNPQTVDGLMCRHQLHVGWDGTLYDCDFNFALNLPVNSTTCRHINDFDPATHLKRLVATGEHCFGCTAGSGSSCGGALA